MFIVLKNVPSTFGLILMAKIQILMAKIQINFIFLWFFEKKHLPLQNFPN